MALQNLEATLEPIFSLYHQKRRPEEFLGDFCARIGFDALRDFSFGYVSTIQTENLKQISLPEDVLKSLEAVAAKQGKSLEHVACEALRNFIK